MLLNKDSSMGYGNATYKIFCETSMDPEAEFLVLDFPSRRGTSKLYCNSR